MRRDGVKYGIRTNHSLKYCYMCVRNEHIDKNLKCDGIRTCSWNNSLPPGVIPFARFTKKPLFTCSHSQGCHMCSHRTKPHHKSQGKIKGSKKERSMNSCTRDFAVCND
eukprot:TRINITY_DN818_c0_g2_i1.p1 TRINITY_DN818_c0_g2~~TRINITY_DN818_c0_g2_i1.p1  ORF type:complete len:109 (-),score=1.47 TRINITY_DN818_c0_g2_i1:4-330(-)